MDGSAIVVDDQTLDANAAAQNVAVCGSIRRVLSEFGVTWMAKGDERVLPDSSAACFLGRLHRPVSWNEARRSLALAALATV
jgi:hypothetical protein